LSGLTAVQSQQVRSLARTVLAERGLEAVVHDNALQLADGRVFGLDNLASVCHNTADQRQWPAVIAAHLDALLNQYGAVPPELTLDQMRAGAHLRLALPQHDWYRYAPRLGEGFAEIIVHRDENFVRHLSDADVERAGYDELRAIGLENLRLIRPDFCELIRCQGAEFFAVRGESGFVASKLLILPEIVRIVAGARTAMPHGVLVAVPTRHELNFAVVDVGAEESLGALAGHAVREYTNGRAPISPYVYWWRDGALTALTTSDSSGRLAPADLAELAVLLTALEQRKAG
jgi:hypothetical protein